jgi:hypothetical protein
MQLLAGFASTTMPRNTTAFNVFIAPPHLICVSPVSEKLLQFSTSFVSINQESLVQWYTALHTYIQSSHL